ncbi:MAG: V-type ATP synthase subunit E, partial [Candidatus Bathyarchaeia archaeon]
MRWVNIAKEISESTRRIRDKIIQDAKERARKIVEEANQKAKRILNEAEAKTRESREQVKAMTEQFYEEELKRRVAKARAENYQQIRSYQAQIVNEVFEKANTEIRNHMLSPEYAGLLRKLIVEAAVALEGGNLIV